MMKKLTIQFLTIAMVIVAFSVIETYAQKCIRFNRNGKAKIRTKIKAHGRKSYVVSGKDFRKLTIKQFRGGKFRYVIRRGSEFLSSGHTIDSNIRVNSDGRSVYSITIINNKNKARSIGLSVINGGASKGEI